MEYIYKTNNTCARNIKMDIQGDVVTNIEFLGGGCNGNLKVISKLVDGWTVEQIEEKCGGVKCGKSSTSCADQLAHAVREAYQASLA